MLLVSLLLLLSGSQVGKLLANCLLTALKGPHIKFYVLRIEMSANFACRWPLAGSRAYYWESANPEIISPV